MNDSFENKVSLFTSSLAKFRELPQFEVLSGVLIAELLDDMESFPRGFSVLSFEKLIEQGGESLLREYSLDEYHLERLIALLRQFVQIEGDIPDSSPQTVTPEEFFRAFCTDDDGEEVACLDRERLIKEEHIPRLSSIEAERQLLRRYILLRESPRYDEMKRLRVTDYWEKEKVRDPFIEELTFREVLEISVPHLLQKKTFTETKVYCLLSAFDRLFQDFDVLYGEES